MRASTWSNKLIGILGIVFGLFCFSPLFLVEKSKLIMHGDKLFIIKYFGPILLINGGLFFVIFGMLNYLGILIPYYSKDIDGSEKAKHHLIALILSVPILISSSAVVFVMANTNLFKILWVLILICILLLFFSSIKTLKRRKI